MNKNVNEMSIVELKSLAYDLIVQAGKIENNLKIVESEIALRMQVPPEPAGLAQSEPIKKEIKTPDEFLPDKVK